MAARLDISAGRIIEGLAIMALFAGLTLMASETAKNRDFRVSVLAQTEGRIPPDDVAEKLLELDGKLGRMQRRLDRAMIPE